jgi:Uma2 family endonuclease
MVTQVNYHLPDALEPEDCAVPLDCCVAVWDGERDVVEDVVVRGLGRGLDVNDERLDAAAMLVVEVVLPADLRKTRAGGNWLTGGIVVCVERKVVCSNCSKD